MLNECRLVCVYKTTEVRTFAVYGQVPFGICSLHQHEYTPPKDDRPYAAKYSETNNCGDLHDLLKSIALVVQADVLQNGLQYVDCTNPNGAGISARMDCKQSFTTFNKN
jgi:hypothetical protein